MSVEMMGLVFKHGPSEATQAFVLLAIADHADDKGRAFPGIALLAKKSRQSERNVMRVLQQLEVEGWLAVSRRAFGVRLKGNVYQMNVAKLSVDAAKSSGDKMSLEARPSGAKKELPEPSRDTVSPDTSRDKTGVHQVTKSTSSGDKTGFPILINHQEPPTEPKTSTTPLPPSKSRGGIENKTESSSVASDPSRNAAGASQAKSERHVCEEAVAKVMRECNVSDPRMRPVIARAMQAFHAKSDGLADCNATAERMIRQRSNYAEDADLLKYTVGVRKFFAHGVWADSRLWPYDQEKLNRMRQARVGT